MRKSGLCIYLDYIMETPALKCHSSVVYLSESYLIKWLFFADTIQLSDGKIKPIYSDIRSDQILSGQLYPAGDSAVKEPSPLGPACPPVCDPC